MENINNNNQLENFKNNLPTRALCTDNLQYGLKVRSAEEASTKRYIQHNDKISNRWIVFDCDYPNALEQADFNNLPIPNIAVINRANGHSHLLYELESPVYTCDNARRKPLAYAANIEHTLTKALKADPCYVGLICKNPLNRYWLTYQVRSENYTLNEFGEYFDIETKPKQGISEISRLGRNCTIFDLLRHWAYTNFVHYTTQDAFFNACFQQASSFNQFINPLSLNEIKAIAKSVAKWVWRNFDLDISNKKFSSLQAYRGKLGGLKGGRPKSTTKNGKPWELEGISRSLWYERNKAA